MIIYIKDYCYYSNRDISAGLFRASLIIISFDSFWLVIFSRTLKSPLRFLLFHNKSSHSTGKQLINKLGLNPPEPICSILPPPLPPIFRSLANTAALIARVLLFFYFCIFSPWTGICFTNDDRWWLSFWLSTGRMHGVCLAPQFSYLFSFFPPKSWESIIVCG